MGTNKSFLTAAMTLLMSFVESPQPRIKVWLVGDSTMADKEVKAYPETGWGMPFAYFFDSTVVVDNRARNGRSSKSFIAEGLWGQVLDGLHPGDYVLIQFGHNDEGKERLGRYTTPQEFTTNLNRYVDETRKKSAIPILITPVARRIFDSSGRVKETHSVYADAVREVAAQARVPLIDLDASSMILLQQFGVEHSKSLYNYLDPGEHPNYPDGHKDDTHFNELGARKMAEMVLFAIRQLNLDLAAHIRPPFAAAGTLKESARAEQKKWIVASDGTGDFRTVQAALDGIPIHNRIPVTIYIKNGLYREKLHLDSTKDNVTMIGQDRFNTILTYDDHPGKLSAQGDSINTRSSYSCLILADDFSARDITFRNDAGFSAGQAVALEVRGDRALFSDCRVIGNQDILFLNCESSRQYYRNCYIEGTTDFIFGSATAWFERCHIHSKKNSHVTAASTPKEHAYGFIFYDCALTADSSIHNASLGRPWRPYASVTYIHCFIDRHIRPEGWSDWNHADTYALSRFAEYKNYGPGAQTAARVRWSRQLSDEEINGYHFKNVFGDWHPGGAEHE